MSLLTTLLLKDSVEKGGPGGGQHPNPGSVSRSANLKSKVAFASKSKAQHLAAAEAHKLASKKHVAAGNFAAGAAHAAKAARHEQLAAAG